MKMDIKAKINFFLISGDERSAKAKKNIAFSMLLKCGSILITFLLVPLAISYVNKAEYGIWLTLSAIIGWMNFFDIGLGNGLRNKLAETNALKQTENSRVLVSTTYAILTIIALGFLATFLLISSFIDWGKILNTHSFTYNFNNVALLVFCLFCIQFVTQILNSILSACHLVARVSLLLLISQVTTLIATVVLIKFTQSSLISLVLINGGIPIVVSICSSLWYYTHDLKEFSPSLKCIDFKYAKQLISLGGLFFIIQIGALVLFQTDNLIITQLFGPADVTVFNVAYKLFSVFILGFDIIIAPLWSAYTDAYIKGDLDWIKSIMQKMRYVCLLISLGSVLLFFMSPFIYKLWLHNNVIVPTTLSLAMVLYIAAYTWQTIHVHFLNGINKIRLQLYSVIISAAVNIPLSIFLSKKIGLAGITLANAILFIIMGSIFSYQVKHILSKTAKGIFNA